MNFYGTILASDMKEGDFVWMTTDWYASYPLGITDSGVIKKPINIKTARDGKFCSGVGMWTKQPFKLADGTTYAASNFPVLKAGVHLCGDQTMPTNGRALDICMKEIYYCDALPKSSIPGITVQRKKRQDAGAGMEDGGKSQDQNKGDGGHSGPGQNKEDKKDEKKKKPKTAIDYAFDPKLKRINRLIKAKSLADGKRTFQSLNLTVAYKSLFEMLWYTQLPCFDVHGKTSSKDQQYGMLKSCFWMGVQIPCSQIFKSVPTDRGICCSFNLENAETMFKSRRFYERVISLQGGDKKRAFLQGEVKSIDIRTKPGKSNGLTVVLDARSNKVSASSVNDDSEGFFTQVQPYNSYPLLQQHSMIIPVGLSSEIRLRPTHVNSGLNLKNAAAPEKRFCLFGDELKLKLHSIYTQKNCQLECYIGFARQNMDKHDPCVPWYFPTEDSSQDRMCSPQETFTFRKMMKLTPAHYCQHCLPDCTMTKYSASISSSSMRRCDQKNIELGEICTFKSNLDPPLWGNDVFNDAKDTQTGITPGWVRAKSNLRKWLNKENATGQVFEGANKRKPVYDSYQTDIAVATFYFDGPTCFEYGRDATMTVIGFISQLGGLTGVCIGFSLMSAVEIVYWFTIRVVTEHKKGA